MSEMTVKERMALDRAEKDRLMKMIVTFQSGHQYTLEDLQGKKLSQLQRIYEKVIHH